MSMNKWRFDNKSTRELPKDEEIDNYSRQVFNSFYSYAKPEQVKNPKLISFSKEVASILDLEEKDCLTEEFTKVFSGNQQLDQMNPHATCYGGHQFGNWAGQLGDGRAINLGDVINSKGDRWALQLKGAGPTPYSRSADGYAVLRSSIREFLCSESMFHLGVPTTRALSLINTGEEVMRDMFYDGNAHYEQGAVVCRVAPSFTRFGHFELPTSRGDIELLKKLANYTLETDFPHIGQGNKENYLKWFQEVATNTAQMIVHWMRVGFVHGVMNTDNMSILGLTIDYGPYGWLENYDPTWTPNTTDASGKRYCFGNQPMIAKWNLVQLANAIYPLIEDVKSLQDILESYSQTYLSGFNNMMANKLGFNVFNQESDQTLIDEIPKLLQIAEIDMTLFYRNISTLNLENNLSKEDIQVNLLPAFYKENELNDTILDKFYSWFLSYQKIFKNRNIKNDGRVNKMNSNNPLYVLRNYLAQEAIELSEKDDHSRVNELLDVLRNPYTEQAGKSKFAEKRPEWARVKPGCSMLSCSS
ncbi:MAG: hypothetical protein COA79_05755 [Planctomycetota bacterium]|nr:MAG: hypothetical protein COA79_05755 [Planctomycetota bacterium]